MGLRTVTPQLKGFFIRHPEVLAVYAFGSMAKGTNRKSRDLELSSDLDLAILFNPQVPKGQRWNRIEKLYGELGTLVKQDLDLIVLNDASLGLTHQILSTGKRVYERVGRLHRREEANLLIQALDLMPTKELVESRAIRRIKGAHG